MGPHKSNKKPGDLRCRKCDVAIGGKSYYIIRINCLYDGESISACTTLTLCSDCHKQLENWLQIEENQY